MLQDLLYYLKDKVHICDSLEKIVDNSGDNLWCTNWMEETFQKTNIDSSTHVVLPLITYQDKTGTDAYQRYLMEPCLLSLTKCSSSWRGQCLLCACLA